MEQSTNTEACPICLSTLDKDIGKGSICRHAFHKSCINKWLIKNSTCPVCRANLTSEYSALIRIIYLLARVLLLIAVILIFVIPTYTQAIDSYPIRVIYWTGFTVISSYPLLYKINISDVMTEVMILIHCCYTISLTILYITLMNGLINDFNTITMFQKVLVILCLLCVMAQWAVVILVLVIGTLMILLNGCIKIIKQYIINRNSDNINRIVSV
jgi:hypothetical protein